MSWWKNKEINEEETFLKQSQVELSFGERKKRERGRNEESCPGIEFE